MTSLAITIGVGLLAFGVYLWQLTVPGFVAAYDSGVYVAASIHFVTGVLPYKDFTFVNPPGIVLLMVPVGVISRIFGSHDGFIAARVLSSFVTALNAGLLAWIVRRRGRLAMVVAGVGLALLPIAFFVSSALKLDPYCVCFVLLGVSVMYYHDQGLGQLSTRRLVLGGLLFGLAAVVKLWAFFPFLALVICLMVRHRRRVIVFAAAAAGGFVVPALPFFVLAPRSFISQIFTVQLFQKANPGDSPSVIWRLTDLTGFLRTSVSPTGAEAVVAFSVLLLVVAIAFARRVEHEGVDAFLLIAAAITVCGLLAAPASATYYGYFAAPFLVGVLAVSLARIGELTRGVVVHVRVSSFIRRLVFSLLVASGSLFIFALTLYTTTFYTRYAQFFGLYSPYLAPVNEVIPPGSCVVYDYVIDGVDSNRLQSSVPNCPSVVDPYGMWQEWGNHLKPPAPTFVAEWRSYFQSAQYVVLSFPHTPYIPWNKSLTLWFAKNYHLIHASDHVFIYAKVASD
ncbi:MAG TPA: glycosyltransferase 87 family protein [Acidimicrobiales bacterium]|nr:glycosyltransferase 87 family protein [Acidimicrobiales bacterium]